MNASSIDKARADKQRILIADDDGDIREVVRLLLRGAGYDVSEAVDGPTAVETVEKCGGNFDLIILDVMMPGFSGITACERIRKLTNAPILFLTAKSQDADKVLGLSAGGDDYLVKPFSYSELSARVRAMVRRYREYSCVDEVKENADDIVLGDICIQRDKGSVILAGEKLLLTDTEYRILLLLAENPTKIFSAQNIYESVWNEPYFYSSNNTVMVHIRNLRRKLSGNSEYGEVIKTVWGRGYHIG